MDDNRQNAYRFLVYWAMLDIRPIAWLRIKWWNPIGIRRHLRRTRLAGQLADRMHNLALFAAADFECFDETKFWRELDSLSDQFQEFDTQRYHYIFETRLLELESST